MSPSKPDVTYLVNVYQRNQGEDRSKERPIRREIWYFKEADLFALNTDRAKYSPLIIPLPDSLPKDFNWSGKMFGMFYELPLTHISRSPSVNISIDAVLSPTSVTLRIGLIDKSDSIPADKCCRQQHTSNTTVAADPLPVGYAGFYFNNDKTTPNKLPPWGILIPVFRPILNLPIIQHVTPQVGVGPETLHRVAYYISTADRPSRHADNIKTLLAAQKRFVVSKDSVDPPSLSIDPDLLDDQGDFKNKESDASFDDMLDSFIPNNDDAQWTGVLFPDAPDPPPFQLPDGQADTTSQDQSGS
ncbi:MAG: hypothetical protein Q9195_007586 [Heterodermia aff. obscurata]